MPTEEFKKYLADMTEARKDVNNLKDWWEENHKDRDSFLLSGTDGQRVWKSLRIDDFVVGSTKILNVGVGLGNCTREMSKRGVVPHVLDISKTALESVKDIVEKGWMPNELCSIPEKHFDLAISHLVAQHMCDADLIDQIKWILQGLKPDGFYAIQTAFPRKKSYEFCENFAAQKWGAVMRSYEHTRDLIKKSGGQIAWIDIILDKTEFDGGWFGIHIVKDNPESLLLYHKKQMNKKVSSLIEKEGDVFVSLDEPEKALNSYIEAIKYDEFNREAHIKCGSMYKSKSSLENAIKMFDKVLALNSIDIEAIIQKGQLLLDSGQLIQAYELFISYAKSCSNDNDPLLINPFFDCFEAYKALGNVFYSAGLLRQAKILFEFALTLNYLSHEVNVKSTELAFRDFSDLSFPKKIEDDYIFLLLAENAIEFGNLDTSRLILEYMLQKNKKNINVLIDLGVLNVLEEKHDEAIILFCEVLKYDPNNETAKENLITIKNEYIGLEK